MNEVREFCITNKLGPEITTPIVRFFRNRLRPPGAFKRP